MNDFLSKIIEDIYHNYPRDKIWGTPEYHMSPEYKKMQYNSSPNKLNVLESNTNKLLQKVIADYPIIPWSNFELYNDVEFKILLHKGQSILDDDTELLDALNGCRRNLYVYVSVIGQYYYLYFEQTTIVSGEYCIQKIKDLTKEELVLRNKLIKSLTNANYKEVSQEIATIILPDIQTELKGFGETRIFDCLFNDIKSYL